MKILKTFLSEIKVDGSDIPNVIGESADMVVKYASENNLVPTEVANNTGPGRRYGVIIEIRFVEKLGKKARS